MDWIINLATYTFMIIFFTLIMPKIIIKQSIKEIKKYLNEIVHDEKLINNIKEFVRKAINEIRKEVLPSTPQIITLSYRHKQEEQQL